MITDALITAVLGSLNALMGLLPSWDAASLDYTDTMPAIQAAGALNSIFPVWEFSLVAAVATAAALALIAWDVAVWIYHQVWGSN